MSRNQQPKGGCLPGIILIIIIGIIGKIIDFFSSNWKPLVSFAAIVLVIVFIIFIASNDLLKKSKCDFDKDSLISIQQKAAFDELIQVSNKVLIGFLGFIFSSFIFIVMYFFFDEPALCYGGIFFMTCFLIMEVIYGNRVIQLHSILDGIKRTYICPFCKSPNIQKKFVKASHTRGHAHTEVSQNINPFKPFTYKNIDTSPVTTSINYKNTYSCKSCGQVFDTPQVYEQK